VRSRRLVVAVPAVAAVAWAAASAVAAGGVGQITGHVAAASGSVCVLALDATGQAQSEPAATDGAGNYVLDGVPSGTWTVEFTPDGGCNGQTTSEAFQFWNAKSTLYAADRVTVTSAGVVPGVDATMELAAQIAGNVTDQAGTALVGVCAILEDTAGQPVLHQLTDQNGHYVLDQLPKGDFVVQFVDDGCVGAGAHFASQYYPAAASPATATTFTLKPGDHRSPVDVALAPAPSPPPGGGGGGGPGPPPPPPPPPTGSPSRKKHASIALLAGAPRGYRVDRRRRLHLPLQCDRGGLKCVGSIHVALPARTRGRAAKTIGHRTFSLPADGRRHTVRVRLKAFRSHRLRLSIYLHGSAHPQIRTTVRVR
jgi:hypothetical protein